MNDEARRSITNQIRRENESVKKEILTHFQPQITGLHEAINIIHIAINTLTERLTALAIRENNLIDEINKRSNKHD